MAECVFGSFKRQEQYFNTSSTPNFLIVSPVQPHTEMNEEETETWRFSGGLSTPVMQLITIGKSWSKQESTFLSKSTVKLPFVFLVCIFSALPISKKSLFSPQYFSAKATTVLLIVGWFFIIIVLWQINCSQKAVLC